MPKSKIINYLAILAVCLMAIFAPDLSALSSSSRSLAVVDGHRELQTAEEQPLPAGMACDCMDGMEPFAVDWSSVTLSGDKTVQKVTLPTGHSVTMSITSTAPGKAVAWGQDADKNVQFTGGTTLSAAQLINPKGGSSPSYPAGYSTMELKFEDELHGLYISISDVDSDTDTADAVRIRMFDAANKTVPTVIAKTGSIVVKENFAFASVANQQARNPGFYASLYAQADGAVKRIALDQSIFTFKSELIGTFKQRSIYPALVFTFCALPLSPTSAPVAGDAAPTYPPHNDPGVNGDPLIMGLSGQLFKFDGANERWYSAVSTPSFQWNLKIQEFEQCPKDSNSFVSGAGFSFFDKNGKNTAKIAVNVVNPYDVDVGCGSDDLKHCLGAGSLELVIDGVKHCVGGDYKTTDGMVRIVAFNTFYQCSRKWYDFDVRPPADQQTLLRNARGLASSSEPGIFDVIAGLKGTMIDEKECDKWIHDRQAYSDLFQQPGHYSTVIIKTEEVTLHLEYKQENERCDAHSIDVWISSVSQGLLIEEWEGMIGETKDVNYVSTGTQYPVERSAVLKYASDEDYEVNSPFSTTCKGCYHKPK